MGGASIWHWVIVGIVVMLLFGRGKISEMMGDVAKGIKAFKKGMSDEDAAPAATPVQPASEPVRTLEHQQAASTPSGATTPLNDRKAV
jgi:sec-independent protein translocase protein TatA